MTCRDLVTPSQRSTSTLETTTRDPNSTYLFFNIISSVLGYATSSCLARSVVQPMSVGLDRCGEDDGVDDLTPNGQGTEAMDAT